MRESGTNTVGSPLLAGQPSAASNTYSPTQNVLLHSGQCDKAGSEFLVDGMSSWGGGHPNRFFGRSRCSK
jgi:hypothetical protein